jgi:hypothetical protein
MTYLHAPMKLPNRLIRRWTAVPRLESPKRPQARFGGVSYAAEKATSHNVVSRRALALASFNGISVGHEIVGVQHSFSMELKRTTCELGVKDGHAMAQVRIRIDDDRSREEAVRQ